MSDALLWSLEEAARQLGGISTKTVRRLAQQGAFPIVKLGRRAMIPVLAATAWVNNNQHARPAQEITKCPSINEVKPTGWTSPSPTGSEYANLLGLPTADTPRRCTTKSRQTSGDNTLSANVRSITGKMPQRRG